MEVSTRDHDDWLILEAEGRIDSKTAKSFETALLTPIKEGRQEVIVDFARLDYISSAGLRVLLMAAKRLRGPDKAFRLCGLNANILQVLQVSGFDRMLSIHDDCAAALAPQEG